MEFTSEVDSISSLSPKRLTLIKKKALEILDKSKDITDSRRNAIKQSAEAKLKRLKK